MSIIFAEMIPQWLYICFRHVEMVGPTVPVLDVPSSIGATILRTDVRTPTVAAVAQLLKHYIRAATGFQL